MPFILLSSAPVLPHVRGSYRNVAVNHENAHDVAGPSSSLSSPQAGFPSSPNPQGGEGGAGSNGSGAGSGGAGGSSGSGGGSGGTGGGGDAGGGGSTGGMGPGGGGPGGGNSGASGIGGTGSGGTVGPMPQHSVNPYVGVRPPPPQCQFGCPVSGCGCSGSMGGYPASMGSGMASSLLSGGPVGNSGIA